MKRILHDEQNVYILGERLRGVQSCQASWINEESYVNSIGYQGGFVGSVTDGPLIGSFDVERLMVSDYDPVVNYIENQNLTGEVVSRANSFRFQGGHINSYSCSCAVGEIPTLSFGVTAYENAGGSIPSSGQSPEADNTFIVAMPGSISLNVRGYNSNAIQSFNVSVTIERQPFQVIGSLQPVHFIPQYPIEIDCQFTMIVDDYESTNLFDAICSPESQDLIFVFQDCDSGNEIRKFNIPDAKLVEYSQSSEVNAPLEATLTYKSLCTDIANIKNILIS